jgi:predicted ATPase
MQATRARGVEALAKKLEDLQRKKAEVFSELMANLDDQELVSRLYEGIQARAERGAVDELILMDLRSNTRVTHRDVGIGISQVLPVLVHAYADEGKVVAIEQPEIHLHPALQAELGDVFIESALGERKNTFLLETHSEHLILRILRRVRETTEGKLPAGTVPIRPEDVSVLFVEPTSQGSVVRHLPVTPDGDFGAPWPGGFFAERFQDLP